MGIFTKKQAEKREPGAIPALFIRALATMDHEDVNCSVYYPDALAAVRPFERVQVELRKPTSRIVPEAYDLEDGSLAVLLDGSFVGFLPPYKAERRGLKPTKAAYAYVMPPYVDTSGGSNSEYRLVLLV